MKAALQGAPEFLRLLARVPGLELSGARITPLSGGITNRNFRVEAGGSAYVLRLNGRGTEQLGIDRSREEACARAAASLGIGPEVICRLPREDCLLTRFIEGKSVSPAAASRPATQKRIVSSIRRCHEGPPFPGFFSPFKAVRRYRGLALRRRVPLPEGAGEALGLLGRIEAALGGGARPKPCHNDLLAANFIDDGRTIRILDWEYAAMGDPFFDLGNFAANLGLAEEDCRLLLKEYCGRASRRDLARLHLYRLASDMREAFWGFLQAGISKLKFDFPAYGAKHLGRFLRQSAGPAFPRALAAALAPGGRP